MRRVGAPHFAPFTSWNPTGYHALNLALRCDRLTATKLVCAAHDDRAASAMAARRSRGVIVGVET